jgi:hypothetical protein
MIYIVQTKEERFSVLCELAGATDMGAEPETIYWGHLRTEWGEEAVSRFYALLEFGEEIVYAASCTWSMEMLWGYKYDYYLLITNKRILLIPERGNHRSSDRVEGIKLSEVCRLEFHPPLFLKDGSLRVHSDCGSRYIIANIEQVAGSALEQVNEYLQQVVSDPRNQFEAQKDDLPLETPSPMPNDKKSVTPVGDESNRLSEMHARIREREKDGKPILSRSGHESGRRETTPKPEKGRERKPTRSKPTLPEVSWGAATGPASAYRDVFAVIPRDEKIYFVAECSAEDSPAMLEVGIGIDFRMYITEFRILFFRIEPYKVVEYEDELIGELFDELSMLALEETSMSLFYTQVRHLAPLIDSENDEAVGLRIVAEPDLDFTVQIHQVVGGSNLSRVVQFAAKRSRFLREKLGATHVPEERPKISKIREVLERWSEEYS